MIGAFERNVHGRFIYKTAAAYVVFEAQGMLMVDCFPRTVNIWQPQLIIWLLARGS